MSASQPRSPNRRASDQVRRQTTLRWGIVGAMVGLSIIPMLGAYWWYRQRDPARDGVPSWTPDSRSLVFSVEVGTRTSDIYIMRADGFGRRNLTPDTDAHDGGPAVSSRGEIAFESDRGGNFEIYVMDPEHPAAARRLTNNRAADRSPAWSPDGSHIVFTSTRDGRVSPDLYIMKADGTDVQRVTTQFSNVAPQYSPDGQQIAFQLNRDVNVLDLGSHAVRRLTFDPQNGMTPTWSPDGKRLAFVTTRNHQAELFTMNPDGSDAKVAVSMPNGNAIEPRWSPDGTRIAFLVVPNDTSPGATGSVQAIYTFDMTSGVISRLSR